MFLCVLLDALRVVKEPAFDVDSYIDKKQYIEVYCWLNFKHHLHLLRHNDTTSKMKALFLDNMLVFAMYRMIYCHMHIHSTNHLTITPAS